MTVVFDDLWRRWFLDPEDGEPALGPYDTREEAEAALREAEQEAYFWLDKASG